MHRQRLAGGAGAVACLSTVVAVAVPYVAVSDPSVVPRYYGTGAVSPLAVGLLGMVGVVAFAAGAYERSDPELVAGLTLVAGAASLLVSLQWALSFGGTALGADRATYNFLETHRWSVLATSLLWTVAAGWYAATLGLVGVVGPEE